MVESARDASTEEKDSQRQTRRAVSSGAYAVRGAGVEVEVFLTTSEFLYGYAYVFFESGVEVDYAVNTEKDVRCENVPSKFSLVHTRDSHDTTEEKMKTSLVTKTLNYKNAAAMLDEVHGPATVAGDRVAKDIVAQRRGD